MDLTESNHGKVETCVQSKPTQNERSQQDQEEWDSCELAELCQRTEDKLNQAAEAEWDRRYQMERAEGILSERVLWNEIERVLQTNQSNANNDRFDKMRENGEKPNLYFDIVVDGRIEGKQAQCGTLEFIQKTEDKLNQAVEAEWDRRYEIGQIKSKGVLYEEIERLVQPNKTNREY